MISPRKMQDQSSGANLTVETDSSDEVTEDTPEAVVTSTRKSYSGSVYSSSPILRRSVFLDGVNPSLHSKIKKTLDTYEKAQEDKRYRAKDKVDHATVESVLDPRTKVVLFKLIASCHIKTLHGCISTGKEANVYHASSEEGDMAVKVYQTSILTFKDRDRYLLGDFRLRYGYCRHNCRKLVSLWALKEYRNMCRLYKSSVLCPKPIACRGNVFIMSLLGEDGIAAPQLKDAQVSQEEASRLYSQVCLFIREMYQVCKLVHADLSEYNIIYHEKNAYIIDVSQAVECDHPNAIDFLYRDCLTVTKYFLNSGVPVVPVDRLFEFAVDTAIEAGSDKSAFDEWLRKEGGQGKAIKSENEAGIVYQTMLIEQKLRNLKNVHDSNVAELLGEVKNRDIRGANEIGLSSFDEEGSSPSSSSGQRTSSSDLTTDSSTEEESEASSVEGEVQGTERRGPAKTVCPRKLGETSEMKKMRKKAVKEMQRNNRLTKVPKHVKKRRKKMAKTNARRK
ncbi:serine:threonine protein kinase RIO1 [Trichuris trichiura]|uniref:Serine/threonine-protein kinase RIO1 n=1 Tax=Trichuris trichiura TaxID=36087 RepID=A0A077ZDV5_TRITR|nr:serine:threonine protein kinase RIO1 [Trichuris trichiura]